MERFSFFWYPKYIYWVVVINREFYFEYDDLKFNRDTLRKGRFNVSFLINGMNNIASLD